MKMSDFTYKGYKYEDTEMEDCIVSYVLFLFEKHEDGEEYYVESPCYPFNMPGYHNLRDCTPDVDLALKRGMDINEAFAKYYKFPTSWIED